VSDQAFIAATIALGVHRDYMARYGLLEAMAPLSLMSFLAPMREAFEGEPGRSDRIESRVDALALQMAKLEARISVLGIR